MTGRESWRADPPPAFEGRATGAGPNRTTRSAVGVWLLFLGLAGMWTVVSWNQGLAGLNSDQQNILLMVLADQRPDLLAADPLFGQPGVFAFYLPWFRAYLAWAAGLTGDLALGYKLLVFPLNVIFLVGAWGLGRDLGLKSAWAAALAVLASLPFAVPGMAEMAGIGPVTRMLPRALFTAALPWLLRGFYRYLQEPRRLAWIFGAAGLAANLHPVSGLLLVEVWLAAVLLAYQGRRRGWLTALTGGLAALAGAAPMLWTYLATGQEGPWVNLPPETLEAILAWRFAHNLYPPLNLKGLPGWAVPGVTALVIAGCGAAALWGKGRRLLLWGGMLGALAYLLYPEGLPYLIFWGAALVLAGKRLPDSPAAHLTACLVAATFAVAIGGAVILQQGGLWMSFPGLAINQTRAARLAPLLLFMGLGLMADALSRSRGQARGRTLVLGLVLLVAVGMQLRLTFRTYLRTKPQPELAALVETARWARTETPPGTVFLADTLAFRLLAERPLTGCAKDGGLWFFAPQGLQEWYDRQRAVAEARGDAARLKELARRWGARYVVLRRPQGDPGAGMAVAFQNDTWRVVRSD